MSRLVGELGQVGRKLSNSVQQIVNQEMLTVKWHRYEDFDEAGNEISEATVEGLAAGLDFLANAAPDTGISSYSGASGGAGAIRYADANANTVKKVIDIINGVGVGQPAPGDPGYMTRYRAGLADMRPGTSLDADSGEVVGPGNILLGGESRGLRFFSNPANLPVPSVYRVSLGAGGSLSGGGQVFADHFESDYVSDTSGNRFPVRDAARRQEEQPGLARYQVWITEIKFFAAFASDDKQIEVYDIDDNLVDTFFLGAGDVVASVNEESPLVMPIGSPAFLEGSGNGAITTDAALSVSGIVRIA